MESVTTLRALLAHDDWGRDRLLELAAPLGDEELDRPFAMGAGSLRGTLRHLAMAEQVWLDRWRGTPGADAMPDEVATETLGERWRATAAERDAFLDARGAGGESGRVTYRTHEGEERTHPLGDLALHVSNHGLHHRAQALNMLRHLGAKVPGLDYLFKVLEPAAAPPTAFDADTIAEYFRYADWARSRVHAVARDLDDDALDRPFEMGPGSLRRTLLHVHDAEHWWRGIWSGGDETFTELPAATSLVELDERSAEIAGERNAFLAGLGDGDLQRMVTARPAPGRSFPFSIGDSMLQLCGHGTHHRAQALNMLRHLGGATPAVDYLVFVESGGCETS